MRVVGSIAILALTLTLTLAGCSSTDKKSPEAKANPPSDRPFWQDPGSGPAAAPSGVAAANRNVPASGAPGGILAGQVRDAYNRPPPPTMIQIVCTDDKQQGGAPIEIATDSQGFFTIQGLQTGRHYQLIAPRRTATAIGRFDAGDPTQSEAPHTGARGLGECQRQGSGVAF